MVAPRLIEARNICKAYAVGEQLLEVLHGVSFSITRGSYVSIVGPSGSGKSTLLHILGCLDVPTSGEYLLNGRAVHRGTPEERAVVRNGNIGFVFQNFNLLNRYSVWDNVALPLVYSPVPRGERAALVEEAICRVGLWDRRYHLPAEISGGQKQRVAIARALIVKPALILADEPTGNLDSHSAGEILETLGRLHADGNTILQITHDMQVAARAQTVYRIVDGRLHTS